MTEGQGHPINIPEHFSETGPKAGLRGLILEGRGLGSVMPPLVACKALVCLRPSCPTMGEHWAFGGHGVQCSQSLANSMPE